METTKVGIREFRDNLATYVLESETPVAITRHGDTVGYFIPTRRKRTAADRDAFREAAAKWQATLDAAGITEEDAIAEYERLKAKRKQ
jgi:antitoxin (DNA-binding transcriptional repressor) of toxin-antitoxin stability system